MTLRAVPKPAIHTKNVAASHLVRRTAYGPRQTGTGLRSMKTDPFARKPLQPPAPQADTVST